MSSLNIGWSADRIEEGQDPDPTPTWHRWLPTRGRRVHIDNWQTSFADGQVFSMKVGTADGRGTRRRGRLVLQ